MLEPTAATSALLYLGSTHVGMPGISVAFLTPDSDNRGCRKLLLLKPCLLDMGHATLSQKHTPPPPTRDIVVTELREVVN